MIRVLGATLIYKCKELTLLRAAGGHAVREVQLGDHFGLCWHGDSFPASFPGDGARAPRDYAVASCSFMVHELHLWGKM